jgi:hypothetical protein
MPIKVREGGAWVQVSDGAGGSGILSGVDVKQTSYDGTNPITTSESAGISTISIPSTSNAYGTRFVETYTPTTEGNNGDVWYQVS